MSNQSKKPVLVFSDLKSVKHKKKMELNNTIKQMIKDDSKTKLDVKRMSKKAKQRFYREMRLELSKN